MCSGESAVKYISLAKPVKDAKNSVLFFSWRSWRSLRENNGKLLSASYLNPCLVNPVILSKN